MDEQKPEAKNPPPTAQSPKPAEGWKKYQPQFGTHYIRDGISLCRLWYGEPPFNGSAADENVCAVCKDKAPKVEV